MSCLKSLFFIAVLIATFESYATPNDADKKILSKRVGVARIFTNPNISTEEKHRLISLAYSGTTPRMVECALSMFGDKKFRYNNFIINLKEAFVVNKLQKQAYDYYSCINKLASEDSLPRDMFRIILKQFTHDELSKFLPHCKEVYGRIKQTSEDIYSNFFSDYFFKALEILPPLDRALFTKETEQMKKNMLNSKLSAKYDATYVKVASEFINILGSIGLNSEAKEYLLKNQFSYSKLHKTMGKIERSGFLNDQGRRFLDYYNKK